MTLTEPSWDEARAAAHAAAVALPVESVPLVDAVGRVLARPVRALTPLPPFDSSAMDGYAVAGPGPWRLLGEVLAGHPWPGTLADGTCVRIATGAAVPAGATAVLRWEDAKVDPAGVVHGSADPGRDIRPAGEEVAQGAELLPAGTLLGPAHVGLAAAAGADSLVVARRPRASVLVFGDELLHEGPARDGRVRDSLGPQLPGWLAQFGVETVAVRHVPDTLDAHVRAVEQADGDLVVTTGGTAAGPVDHLHHTLERVGATLVVDSVAVRPGHPMLLARWPARWLIGLPGNPQSAVVALLSLGSPLVAGLAGQPLPPLGTRVLAVDVGAPATETRLVLSRSDGGTVRPVTHLGSGMLRGLAVADGFAVVPPGGQPAGATVRWLPVG
jgi:molybdopterin molybdotransferase